MFYGSTDKKSQLSCWITVTKNVVSIDVIEKTMARIRRLCALVQKVIEFPDEIYVARKDSQMIIDVKDGDHISNSVKNFSDKCR